SLLECPGRAAVQRATPIAIDARVRALAQFVVREADAVGGRLDDVLLDQLRDSFERIVLGLAAHRQELRLRRAAAEDGDRFGDALRERRQAIEPAIDEIADRAGQRERPVFVARADAPLAGASRDQLLRDRRAQVFGDEKRIALGLRDEKMQKAPRHVGRGEHGPHDLRDVAVIESIQQQLRHVIAREERAQIGPRFVGAIRAENHERESFEEFAAEGGEEAERDLVGPLQIVDEQQQLALARERRERFREIAEETATHSRGRNARRLFVGERIERRVEVAQYGESIAENALDDVSLSAAVIGDRAQQWTQWMQRLSADRIAFAG